MNLGLWAILLTLISAIHTAHGASILLPDIDPTASTPIGAPVSYKMCTAETRNGYPVPDPDCTPGAINPTVTLADLMNPDFSTSMLRNKATVYGIKYTMYALYGIPYPANNSGSTMTCELDHDVPLELGGADTLDNIWAQCGVDANGYPYFRMKDKIESYLHKQVIDGKMKLSDAQKGIAADWTQYIKYVN